MVQMIFRMNGCFIYMVEVDSFDNPLLKKAKAALERNHPIVLAS